MYHQNIAVVNFYGNHIPTIKIDSGEIFVSIRAVTDNIGLNWDAQRDKIVKFMNIALLEGGYDRIGAQNIALNIDGEGTSVLCVPLKRLNTFLFSINPNQIQDAEIKTRMIKYQEECVIALHDYWLHGAAFNGRNNPSDIDSGYKDARAYSRPALVASCNRVAEYAAKELGKTVDAEDTYNRLIGYAYNRVGLPSVSDKQPLGDTAIESGWVSLKLAFIECSISAALGYIIAYQHHTDDIPAFVELHVNEKLAQVGHEFFALADFVPNSMFEDKAL